MEFVREANHPTYVFACVSDSEWRKIWEMQIMKDVNPLRAKFFREHKHIFTFYAIPPQL